jgi:hypothetical protein
MEIIFAEHLDTDAIHEVLTNGLAGATINFFTTNGVRHTNVVAGVAELGAFLWIDSSRKNQLTNRHEFWDRLANIAEVEVVAGPVV